MVVVYLIFGGLQLLAAIVMYKLCRKSAAQAVSTIVGGLFLLFLLTSVAPGASTLLQALTLLVLGVSLLILQASERVYAVSAIVVTLMVPIVIGGQNVLRMQRLAERYPLTSIRERLAFNADLNNSDVESPTIPPEALEKVENEVKQLENALHSVRLPRSQDQFALQQIHRAKIDQFMEAPGFGVGRMGIDFVFRLKNVTEPQPMKFPERPPEVASSGEKSASPTEAAVQQLATSFSPAHREAQTNFTASRGLGYVRDIDHVAGFEPHGFSEDRHGNPSDLARAIENRIVRLELVSLLKHSPPRVYVSDELPDMAKLDDMKTRLLDQFEVRALDKLRVNPAELVAEPARGRIRVVGSILAVERCQECHRAEVGDLLGAFSYELLPEGVDKLKPDNGSDRDIY